jgi:hypothetical protein
VSLPAGFDAAVRRALSGEAIIDPRLPLRRTFARRISRLPRREGRHYSCRISGGCFVVLVDEAAEPVATVDLAGR